MSAFEFVQLMEIEKQKQAHHAIVMSYSHLLLCRDRDDGSLRGLSLCGLERRKSYTIVKLGMMLCHSQYRGGPWMKLAPAVLVIRELFLHPLTPIYMVARVSTYKMYIQLYTYFSEFYPHHQREAPELYKKIAEDYTTSIRSSSDSYDRDSLILKRRVGFVKESVAPISEMELQDCRIRFFSEQNCGWREGDQMVCVLRLQWNDVLGGLLVLFTQFLQRSRKESKKANDSNNSDTRWGRGTRPSLLKNGMIFQDPAANLELSVYEFGDKEGTPLRNHPFPTSPKGSVRENFVSEGEISTATNDEIEFDINLSF